MSTTFHVIHFVPELGVPSQHLLGVLLCDGGPVRWLAAPLPDLRTVLSTEKLQLLSAVQGAIAASPAAALPLVPFEDAAAPSRHSGFGNHFLISPPRQVPAVSDPAGWIRQAILPSRLPRSQPLALVGLSARGAPAAQPDPIADIGARELSMQPAEAHR